MTEPDPQRSPPSVIRTVPTWFLAVVTVPIILGLIWFGRDFLIPIALATLLFILNMALIDRLDHLQVAGKSVPRWLAYILATAFLVLVFVLLGDIVAKQVDAMTDAAPRYSARFAAISNQIESWMGFDVSARAQRLMQDAGIGSWLAGFAASASGVVGNIGLVLLYLAFMLAERGAFTEKLPRLSGSPEEARRISNVLKKISLGVRQYMWINTVTSAMSGTLAFIVLKAVGVDFAASLALLVFALNFIPNIGSVLAVVFPTLVALLQFDSFLPALIVVVVYGGGDAIIGNIVQPRLQGKSLNLSPLMVMVALAFWGIMWGGVGAFMAVPLTVVLMIVCSQIAGLKNIARLLSSDGILPGDTDYETGSEDTGSVGSEANDQAASSEHIGTKPERDDDGVDTEVAALRQELEDLKPARRKGAAASDDH